MGEGSSEAYANGYACLERHEDWVEGMCFAHDSRMLATASFDKLVRLWDVDGKVEPVSLVGHTEWVRTVSFDSIGTRIASASDDAKVRVWDVPGRKEALCIRGHTDMVFGVAFSPDDRHLASASFDGTVRVWVALRDLFGSGQRIDSEPHECQVGDHANGFFISRSPILIRVGKILENMRRELRTER